MLAENLILLRNMKGMSQEQIAEVIGISRQSYAKWEQGETVPDIEKCDRLAKFYDITIDAASKVSNTTITTKKPVVDIMLVLDVSGSMGDSINTSESICGGR
mgnify:CR=1 FL=1